MKNVTPFRKSPLATGLSLAMASTFAATLPAQAQTPQERLVEEVLVTASYRASLIDSISSKRDSTSVIEAISAEDIGKLPDSSIADSIARLPGLAAQRLDGRASSVSIRGLGENFSAATVNGREQVSLGDNRGVEFDLYPAEIMSGVLVYKTPDASLATQGIAGVIDLRTVRPLDYDERVIQFNAFYEENQIGHANPDGDDAGQRATFSYIDQYMDKRLGVAVVANAMASPNNEDRWNAWGYPSTADGDFVLGGAKPFVRSSMLERDTFTGVVEFDATDKLTLTADAMYIDFVDEKILRGIEIPGFWNGFTNNARTEVISTDNGFVTEGVFVDSMVQVRNDLERREAQLTTFGVNAEYEFNADWRLEFAYGHSQVERTVWSLESYSGTGRGNDVGSSDTIGFNQVNQQGTTFSPGLDYSDFDLISLGGALNWGNGTTVPSDGQDGFINIPEIEDELDTLRLWLTRDFDDGAFLTAINGGLYYSDREKSKTDTGIFLTLPQYPDTLPIPEEYIVGAVSLAFIGMGDMVAYDSFRFWRDGGYVETPEDLTVGARSVNDWTVSEEIAIAYVKADFTTPIFGVDITGNIGVQWVDTDQSSTGKAVQIVDGLVEVVDSAGGTSYDDFLPSLKVNVMLSEEQQLRLGLSRTLSRARMDRMNAGFSYGFDNARNVPGGAPFTAAGGNPALAPNIANQFDISYEYYFRDDGYLAIAGYYKDLRNWQVQTDVPFDIADLIDPAALPDEIQSTLGLANVWTQAEGGDISGLELTAAVPFGGFSASLEGLGVVASASFIDSSLDSPDGSEIPVPGLSDEIFNVTAYFERAGFQARASLRKRSDFQGQRFGTSFTREDITVVGAELWDAQIGYDFSESGIGWLDGFVLTLQGMNLSDEPYITRNGEGFIVDYQEYGRTFLLGASYKF